MIKPRTDRKMKVYKVVADVDAFQSIHVEDGSLWGAPMLEFDGTSKAAGWLPPEVYVLMPKLVKGNFYHLTPGAFVVDSVACETLRSLFERCAELLPLPHEGETLQVVNVTQCINVLDKKRTEWEYGPRTGKPIRLVKHVFKPNRFIETPLFKIPETATAHIYTIEGQKDPEDEFKFNVESKGLKGLLFKEVWAEE